MVFLIFAYLVPIIMMIISFSIRIIRKNEVTVNFISPFPCFTATLGGVTIILSINMIYHPSISILISLAFVYFLFSLYNLFGMSYLCEDFFIYGFKKIEVSLISCNVSNNRVLLYVCQEEFMPLYVRKTELNKLKKTLNVM